jgi:hypothetical protein
VSLETSHIISLHTLLSISIIVIIQLSACIKNAPSFTAVCYSFRVVSALILRDKNTKM